VKDAILTIFKADEALLKKVGIWALAVVYTAGSIGISSVYKEWFLGFTGLNLLLTAGLLLINTSSLTATKAAVFLAVCAMGYTMEVLGVQTGAIFGSYYYGNALGIKVLAVPLTIGLNWGTLTFSAAFLVKNWRMHWVLKALIGGTVPVLLDVFIEPICHELDFWYWATPTAPLQNYVVWYALSALFVGLFLRTLGTSRNGLAPWHLLITGLFFVVLNLLP